MELEQRVKTLEYEMKILKNEVQRTLLDIQEQVLVHYYPVLRTEETKPSEGTIQAIETLRSRQTHQPPPVVPSTQAPAPDAPSAAVAPAPVAAPAAVAAAPTPVAAAAAPMPVPEASIASAAPALKKVTLEEIRAAQNDLAVDSAGKPGGAAPQTDTGSNASGNGNGAEADRSSLKLLELLTASKSAAAGEDKQATLDQLTKLNSLVERAGSVEEALRMLGEAKLG